jgi:hypothetical protein
MWKESAVVQLKALPWHFSGGNEETNSILCRESRPRVRDMKPGTPDCMVQDCIQWRFCKRISTVESPGYTMLLLVLLVYLEPR